MTREHGASRSPGGRIHTGGHDVDDLEAEHDRNRARRSSLADLTRHGADVENDKHAPLRVGETAEAGAETKAPGAGLPAGHGSREIKLEFGDGTVTGGITATLEYGKTGVPLGPDQIKALENTSAVQLNGLKAKLESAILSGELDGELFEGLKISIEANAIKAGIDSDGEAEVDLMTITVKLVGDAGHLLAAGPGVTLTVDGNLTIALGGKLAAQLSSFTVAQLEQQMLAKEMSELGSQLDDSARKVKDLHAKADLLESQGSFKEAGRLREEAAGHRLTMSTAQQQLDGHKSKLKAAKARTDKAIAKLHGNVAKQVAKAMEKKAIKFVATKLMKLVPILNLVSTLIDVIELAGAIKNLIEGDYGGAGGDAKREAKDAGGDGGEARKAPATSAPADTAVSPQSARNDSSTTAPRDGEPRVDGTGGSTAEEVWQARGTLNPAARAVVDALTSRGPGALLTADQIKMIGLLVPQDLTADGLTDLLATLREVGGKARTAEEVIEAVSLAVRAIQNRNRTVKVNGEARSDLSAGGATDERVKETSGSTGSAGPVISPNQVDGPTRAMEVVRGGDAATIGRWFKADESQLVWSTEGEAWRNEHERTVIAPSTELVGIEETITNSGANRWNLELRFRVRQGDDHDIFIHRFLVYRGGEDDGMGAKVGELKFEGYIVVGGT